MSRCTVAYELFDWPSALLEMSESYQQLEHSHISNNSNGAAHRPPGLTFPHRSGVSPYTSTCVLAGTCVFSKQSPEKLSLRATPLLAELRGQALSLSYGRFFAEFLSEESLVPLGLLALSTCVGLRYGADTINLRSFSGKPIQKS